MNMMNIHRIARGAPDLIRSAEFALLNLSIESLRG